MRKASSSATAPSQTGLTSSLRRLITNPKRFGAINLWKALTPDERVAAATYYLAEEADARQRLNRIVARARNFRPATVQRWPEEKVVKAIRHVPLNDDPRIRAKLIRGRPWTRRKTWFGLQPARSWKSSVCGRRRSTC